MRSNLQNLFGITFILFGLLLVSFVPQNLTGLIILENTKEISHRFAGLFFLVGGIAVMLLKKHRQKH